jgi:hypothetical protein
MPLTLIVIVSGEFEQAAGGKGMVKAYRFAIALKSVGDGPFLTTTGSSAYDAAGVEFPGVEAGLYSFSADRI